LYKTAFLALIHATLCYTSPLTSLGPFSGPTAPTHTPLLAHVYGIANLLMGAIRAQAACDVGNKAVYDLALGTYVAVLWLLGSECVVWGTGRWAAAVVPGVVGFVGVGWMGVRRV
ncbi:hypothetical protein BU23DRAFT_459364, partial [Bimuria novae-zelandiae CBS 107.79]